MDNDARVSRFDVRAQPTWTGQDIAEMLVVYLSGYKSKVFRSDAERNTWQLGEGNNAWLRQDGTRFWVHLRYAWSRETVVALGVLLKRLYGLEIVIE